MQIPSLKGQRIVIIGGSSGVGHAVAACAIAEGAVVIIGSTNAAKIDAAVKPLGQQAQGRVIDVQDEKSVDAFFSAVGGFDHLVFTAGDGGPDMAPVSLNDMDFHTAGNGLNVRFWGALKAIKHAQSELAPEGSITLTDGILSHRPAKGMPLTTAFSGAIEHLVLGLAVELAPRRVNSVCLGPIRTNLGNRMPEAQIQKMTANQPIPRVGNPEEAAQAYLYLMRGTYTTGQVIHVDGGRTLG
ncbi:MAG: SDR family oxidoreductase [Acidobacteriota bacterium]|nr:SDR family oxidoreductase [Acidobacteriota bacterium]